MPSLILYLLCSSVSLPLTTKVYNQLKDQPVNGNKKVELETSAELSSYPLKGQSGGLDLSWSVEVGLK